MVDNLLLFVCFLPHPLFVQVTSHSNSLLIVLLICSVNTTIRAKGDKQVHVCSARYHPVSGCPVDYSSDISRCGGLLLAEAKSKHKLSRYGSHRSKRIRAFVFLKMKFKALNGEI